MTTLLALPDPIRVEILSVWLHLGDLRNLDSAFCTSRFRFEFVDLLANPHLVFRSYRQHTMQFVNWLIKRRFKLQSLIGHELEDIGLKFWVQLDLSKLISLSFPENLKENDFLNIILMVNSCLSLSSLSLPNLKGFGDFYFLQIKPELLSGLTDLSLGHDNSGISAESVKYIMEHSTRLKTVSVDSMTVPNIVWLDLFTSLQCLEDLTVSIEIDDNFLMVTANECKRLTKFCSMKCNENLSLSVVGEFIRQQGENLKLFHLNYDVLAYEYDDDGEDLCFLTQSIVFKRNASSGETHLAIEDEEVGFITEAFHDQIVHLLLSLDGLQSIYMTTKPFLTTATANAIISKHKYSLNQLNLHIISADVMWSGLSPLISECPNLHMVILRGHRHAESYIECCFEPFMSTVISVVDLTVADFDLLTNEMVCTILDTNKQLNKLTVVRCKQVGLSMVRDFVKDNGFGTVISDEGMFYCSWW